MAAESPLPDFIRQHVRSVWGLEILLLLRREPERSWTAAAVARELRATERLAASSLEHFERSGLAIPDSPGHYRYAPASPVLSELCDALQAAYRERPVAVINLISAPEDRLQQLADAFRFRGDRR